MFKKRKLIIAVILTFGITAFINSCKKEMPLDPTETINQTLESVQVSDYSLVNIPIPENKQNIEELLKNPEDRDDEKINKYLYELSLATRELIKDAKWH